MRKPIVMMSETSQYWELTGDKVRADSWFGYTDGLHTVSVSVSEFTGAFGIQGTLELNPTESDWFDINLTTASDGTACPLVRYPLIPDGPTGKESGDTGVQAYSFVGNFVYLRALMVRDYLGQEPASNYDILDLKVGSITRVLLSL